MRTDGVQTSGVAGLAIKGSQRQLQLHVNAPELRAGLNELLCGAAPLITSGSIQWKSPVLSEGYREYSDRGFLMALGWPELAEALDEFWPRGGPVWDGLATFRTPDGERGALLVEAKAHVGELLRGGSLGKSVAARSRSTIEKRLAETRGKLGVEVAAREWTVDRYQSANRLAHAVWLGGRVPTVLAHVLFYDDPTHIADSEERLKEAAARVYEGLGFTGAAPSFAVTATCAGVHPTHIAPTQVPDWARDPVDLDGLELTAGSYPPEPWEEARLDQPRWAMIGQSGRENDEIAVAAFPGWLEFSSLCVWWDGHHPVRAAKSVQRVAWSEFPSDAGAALAAVRLLARATAKRRRRSYRRCADCAEWVAPEHRDRLDRRYVCHGCQEQFHGVVH